MNSSRCIVCDRTFATDEDRAAWRMKDVCWGTHTYWCAQNTVDWRERTHTLEEKIQPLLDAVKEIRSGASHESIQKLNNAYDEYVKK